MPTISSLTANGGNLSLSGVTGITTFTAATGVHMPVVTNKQTCIIPPTVITKDLFKQQIRETYTSITSPAFKGYATVGIDGNIYGVPGGSGNVTFFNTQTNTGSAIYVGTTFVTTPFQYAGASLGFDGKIYGIPHSANNILILNTELLTATKAQMGMTNLSADVTAKWLGSVLAPDGKIYGVPYSAADILIIDTVALTATRSTMGMNSTTNWTLSLSGTFKWAGGALASDGKIYCTPQDATDFLIIDTINLSACRSTLGMNGATGTTSLSGLNKYRGGCLAPNGKIYCPPWNGSGQNPYILIIDTVAGTASTSNMGYDFRANLIKSYAYGSGTVAPDGKIYCPPINEIKPLIIDPQTNTATVGITLPGATANADNYWQILIGPNGNAYFINSSAATMGRLQLSEANKVQIPLKYCVSAYYNRF